MVNEIMLATICPILLKCENVIIPIGSLPHRHGKLFLRISQFLLSHASAGRSWKENEPILEPRKSCL